MADVYLHDSVHAKAVTYVQRMDVWVERQKSQGVVFNAVLGHSGESILRLAQTHVVQLSGFTTAIAAAIDIRYYETG